MAISDKQLKILSFPYSPYTALICDGAIRTGKTSLMMVSFVDWAMENFSGQTFGICGKTVDSAVKNIIQPYRLMAHGRRKGYEMAWRRTDKTLEVRKGARVNRFEVFGGKDESSYMLIQGRTLAGVLLDEVPLMPESFFNQALARCSVDGARFWFSSNPASPLHWYYREWIRQPEKHNALYIHFDLADNPALSDETRARYESQYSGVFYERYILGRWVVAQGLVYEGFAKWHPVVDTDTSTLAGRFFLSVDYGTHNPCAMQLWCVADGRALLVDEAYYDSREAGAQRTDEEHYAALEQLAAGRYIQSVIVDPSAASFIETIRRHGRFVVRGAENAVVPGINVCAGLMQCGRLKIHARCENTIREAGLYRWDDKKAEDAVVKEYDHAMDAMRYFAATVLCREFRWVPWRE